MNVLPRREAAYAPDDYLTGLHVDGREAARILGFSAARFRQLSGTREQPAPLLGPPTVEKGDRSGKWPLRKVLEFGIAQGRDMTIPAPPLLPHPAGTPRYRRSSVPPRAVRIEDDRGVVRESWAQLYEPTSVGAPCSAAPDLLLLTPLWPSEIRWSLRALAARFVVDAGMSRRYADEAGSVLTVVEMPVAVGHSAPWGLHIELMASAAVVDPSPKSWRDMGPAHRLVPFEDLAECLGWKGVPVWPEGTASSGTLAVWSPGNPVPLSVPVQWRDRWAGAQLALRKAAELEETDPLLAASFRELEDSIHGMMRSQTRHPMRLDPGSTWAVDWQIPDREPIAHTASFIPAMDAIAADPTWPAHLSDALLSYFGDRRYSLPVTVDLRTLPPVWRERFEALRRRSDPIPDVDRAAARIRRLERASWAASSEQPELLVDGRTLMAAAGEQLTWLAWNGYDSHDVDDPALAWQQDASDVLLVRSAEPRLVGGWLSTPDGRMSPLPSVRGSYDFVTLARIAQGVDVWELRRSAALEQLLDTVTPDSPQTLSLPDFVALVRRLEDY